MRIKRFQRLVLSAVVPAALACSLFSSAASANLLTDPGFENQTAAPNPNPTLIPGWSTFGGANFLNTPVAHAGSWVMDDPAGGGGYSVPGAYQTFAASAGQTYAFSGWVYTPNALVTGSNDFAILQISPFNASGAGIGSPFGVDVGTPAGGGGVPLPQATWVHASITGTMPAGTATVGVYLLGINADTNGTFYFDDADLEVPEPASLGLLAMGLPMLLRRRRKA